MLQYKKFNHRLTISSYETVGPFTCNVTYAPNRSEPEYRVHN